MALRNDPSMACLAALYCPFARLSAARAALKIFYGDNNSTTEEVLSTFGETSGMLSSNGHIAS